MATRDRDVSRVSADVDGFAVWIESSDATLAPSAEVFASAFLLPGLAHHRALLSEAPFDPQWAESAPRLVEVFHRWWRYPRLVPCSEDSVSSPRAGADSAASPRARGLFFSGGVDSFHALLEGGETIDVLVFVEGLDIPLGDARRFDASLAGIREVAKETGTRLVTVRTNLREHPLIRDTSWERTNGGALAAIAHALASVVGEMIVASSVAIVWEMPWGSHWETDPLLSSSRVRLRHQGHELRRIDKVRKIAAHALPQKHLRVCWQNHTAALNCSRCGKCVITRLMIADSGLLDRFATLEGTATLARDVDAIPNDSHRHSLQDLVLTGHLEPALQDSAARLLRRIEHAQSFPVKTRRRVLRTLLRWAGRA